MYNDESFVERRKVSHAEILDRIDGHGKVIKENHDNIKIINSTLKTIEQDVKPFTDLMEDIATVGRIGRCLGKFLKWFSGIIVALGILWAALHNWFSSVWTSIMSLFK